MLIGLQEEFTLPNAAVTKIIQFVRRMQAKSALALGVDPAKAAGGVGVPSSSWSVKRLQRLKAVNYDKLVGRDFQRIHEFEVDMSQLPFKPTRTEPWKMYIRDPVGAALSLLMDTSVSGTTSSCIAKP
jgi:hypothetical protein